MTDDRKGGLALIAGTLGSIVTMSLHPTGHDLMSPGQAEVMARLTVFVHALALASLPILFLGVLALARRLDGPGRQGLAGLVVYGFGLTAVMSAATASGLVAPGVVRAMIDAVPADRPQLQALFQYTGRLNQGYAQVFAIASSAAILLWSAALVRRAGFARALGFYGLLLGAALVLAVGSGHLHLGVHGFGILVFTQALWFVGAGAWLAGHDTAATPA